MPFFLRAPNAEDEADEEDGDEAEEAPGDRAHRWRPAEDAEEGPESHDLFPPGSARFRHAAENDYAEDGDTGEQEHGRYIIDDMAPFDFGAPVARPLPERPEGGLLTLVALAVLGLIFFAGGIFWATYARPTAESHVFSPRLVGGLAGVAGVGFFVVAVYLLLDRLGRASEREARSRP